MHDYSMERSERPVSDTWALEDMYPSEEAWRADLERAGEMAQEIPAWKGKLGSSADSLLGYLRQETELGLLLMKVYGWASRKSDEDTRVSKYQGMVSEAVRVLVAASEAGSFETPELLAIPEERLEAFYHDQPALEEYRRHLNLQLRRRAHVLSEAEEKLLASAGEVMQTPENIYSLFADSDLKFPDAVDAAGEHHPLSAASYIGFLQSPDRVLRRSAFENLYHTWGDWKNTVAAVLAGQVKQLAFQAKARRYPDPLTASLDMNEVPVSVYYKLIEAVHDNIGLMHRYTALRRKLMGLEELHMYDIYTPLVPDSDAEYTLDQAKEIVCEALRPLGEEYQAILREGLSSRWMDPYPNPGKRSGAYSSGERVHPFVLLNFDGTLDSVFTLAHEFGHAIHSWLSSRTQKPVDSEYVIFVAEVASTCNEALVMQYLLKKTTDRRERAYLINHFLEQFRGTLYRQTMFAEFELKLGQLDARGVPLTADLLCDEYRKLNAFYYGDAVISDEEIGAEWERIPHFYYNYYVFQYATGFSAAIALSQRILREGEPAVRDYLGFLSGGCSTDPISLLRGAGVDMADPKTVSDALQMFGSLLDEMETLMAEGQ